MRIDCCQMIDGVHMERLSPSRRGVPHGFPIGTLSISAYMHEYELIAGRLAP